MSLFGYDIPHEHMRPVRDMIRVQMPFPPRRIGSIITPDMWRDLSQHVHQMGIIRAMGPLAFAYKDGDGLSRDPVKEGDWVMFKWGAGTSFNPSRGVVVSGGWRYLSSFNDVVSVTSAEHMPDPSTLCWVDDDSETSKAFEDNKRGPDFSFDNSRVVGVGGGFR